MLYIGCIADDFTGASDAASFLRRSGLKTLYLNGDRMSALSRDEDAEAVVVALKCRSIPAAEAMAQAEEAARWLLERGAQHLYYKYCSTFDSTAKGNIGPVTETLMSLCGTDWTILCPALPVNGRTVRDGVLYVNGVPLAESPMRHHPLNPMTESEIPKLMAMRSRYPCYCVDRKLLWGDPERLEAQMDAWGRGGPFTAAVDYGEDADGAQIAACFGALPLLTGGSGLLEHLGRRYLGGTGRKAGDGETPLSAGGRRLLLAGSCSEMTLRQVRRFRDAGGVALRVDPQMLLSGAQTVESLERALDESRGDILFYSSDTAEKVEANQRFGAERVSALLEDCMGRLAVHAVEDGCRRLVVAGGETSGKVMLALGYDAFQIREDVAPGVPRMVPLARPDLSLALKSGNFGAEDFFLTALVPENAQNA
ncbi:MAG: four-carbon acid sugar kinase family protein [Oscillospiraceae bacterium]|nr:four-carbon acid sugar kinase family protein [Oscillospiraceae bacterium]